MYGRGNEKGAEFALELTLWSHDIVLCTDGPSGIDDTHRQRLRSHRIEVNEKAIVRVEGTASREVRIVFADGTVMERRAMFFNTARHQRSDLARRLGCDEFGIEGCRLERKVGKTHVPGLYVIGDASRDVLQVIVAAGEGAEAAITINSELLHDDGVL